MKHRFRSLFGVAVFSCLFIAQSAQAYVLPLGFQMRLYAKNRAKMGIVDLTIDMEVITYGDQGEEHAQQARLYLKKGAGMRLVLNAGQPDAAVMVDRGNVRKVSKKTPELALLPDKDMLLALFAPNGEKQDKMSQYILRSLARLGIDARTVGFKHYKSYVLYITGAKSYEADKNQAWFHKESGLPFMVRYRTNGLDGAPHTFEIWMRQFGSSEAGNWFPAEIEFTRDGKRVMTWRLEKASKNTSLPNTLFTTVSGS